MKTQLLSSDIGLLVPAILLPIGNISDQGRNFLKILASEPFQVETIHDELFKKVCNAKNVSIPETFQSTIYVCNSVSEYMMIRSRLLTESSLFYLKCFVLFAFVDYTVNKDIRGSKEISKGFAVSPSQMNYVIYRATTDLIEEHSEHTHISFDTYVESVAAINIRQFLQPLILQSIQSQVTGIVQSAGKSNTNHRTALAQTVISRQTLFFISSEKNERISAFNTTFKTLDSWKEIDCNKYGTVYEILGRYEEEVPNVVRDFKLFEKTPGINPLWDIDSLDADKDDDNNNNSRHGSSNVDPVDIYNLAAGSYSIAKSTLKVIDCAFHIFACLEKRKSTNYKLISYIINDVARIIIAHIEEENVNSMQGRAWELMTFALRLKQNRKIPLLSYQFGESFKGDAKIDFLLQTIEGLYRQTDSEVIVRDLCGPIVASLLSCSLEPSAICRMIFRLLSLIGTVLPKSEQERLFMRLLDLAAGDIRIPCDIGLKASNPKIVLPASFKVRFTSPSASNGFANNISSPKASPFIYNGLCADSCQVDTIVAVGSQFRVEFDVFNPFLTDLPIIISGSNVHGCTSDEYPLPLKAKDNSKAICCLTPADESQITIDSFDAVIYEGVQKIPLPSSLTVTALKGVAEFFVRTDLPINQILHLFDGEILKVNVWLTNSGKGPIENLSIVFPAHINASVDDFPLPVEPFQAVQVNLTLKICRRLSHISFDVIAQTSNKAIESVAHIEQPIEVEAAISIAGIQTLTSLPEIEADFSRLVFIAVDLQNESSSMFNYTVCFDSSAEIGFDFPGIVKKKPCSGVLSAFKTTSIILAVEKSIIENPPVEANRIRMINAAKDQEEKLNKKLTKTLRQELDLRVKIATFIERQLEFKWFCGADKNGILSANAALPTEELMKEIRLHRPKVSHEITTIENKNKEKQDITLHNDMNEKGKVQMNKKVKLTFKFEYALVVRCELLLGIYQDSDYGLFWNGSLEKFSETGESNFDFTLFFIKQGKFDLRIEYETNEKVIGHSSLEIEVI